MTSTVLVKLSFLLRRETVFADDQTFYDFVPYKYGPFSFALYRELDCLQRDGLVSNTGERLTLNRMEMARIQNCISGLTNDIWSAVSSVTKKYGLLNHDELLSDVYRRYPWYATRSERSDLGAPCSRGVKPTLPAVYTIGYQQKSVDAFFDTLLRSGAQVIMDVRANPVSRKYGFAGSSMRSIAERLDIEYHHLPRLGIPSAERAGLGSEASYTRLLDMYENRILPEREADTRELARMMEMKSSVLVCMEKDPNCCHRSRLASAVSKVNGLPINHLS